MAEVFKVARGRGVLAFMLPVGSITVRRYGRRRSANFTLLNEKRFSVVLHRSTNFNSYGAALRSACLGRFLHQFGQFLFVFRQFLFVLVG